MTEREEYGEGKELLISEVWAHVAACGTTVVPFIGDVTADKPSRMNSEVYQALLSAHIQPNASNCIRWRLMVHIDDDTKHTAKADHVFSVECYDQVRHLT